MNLNPLDKPGEVFDLELMNPNPRGGKTKNGPVYRVSFEVDQDTYLQFMDANTKGMIIAAKCCVVDENPPEEKPKTDKGPHGQYVSAMYRMGTLYQVDVASAVGTDEDFKHWIRRQPDFLTGEFSEYKDGDGRCVYAHVPDPTRHYSDIENKPIFSGLPMLQNEQHLIQHAKGWSELFDAENDLSALEIARKHRDKYLAEWIKSELRKLFHVESLTWIEPISLYRWAEGNGIKKYFPKVVVN